ncbi:hypothetical protein [Parasphingorhabdus cellanae]|uniref:Uncharacterized protein n=1 Tax=Parasphingorhabdus cellanae TaxID=2806553 RepID=A0ABX7T5G7_9SPHN|nr:hypothetical protein [Parasphingorhabdus cellanae]QTD55228.1 hypothetical protein J4G78_13500 [Parasphingorhabdus cellanae]
MFPPNYMFKRRRRQGSLIGSTVLTTAMIVTALVAVMPFVANAKGAKFKTQFVHHDDLDLALAKNLCSLPGIAAETLRREISDGVNETKANALQNLERKILALNADARP